MANRGKAILVYLRENTVEGLKYRPKLNPPVLIVSLVLYVVVT